MTIKEFYYKGKAKLRYLFYNRNYGKNWYPSLYFSYWHMKLQRHVPEEKYQNYFAARPNPGAGIGHQMANWIAGYWYAEQLGLPFAHIPFSDSAIPYTSSSWEDFLGFGNGEISVAKLVKEEGYKIVRIPLFEEKKKNDLDMIQHIIRSYSNQKTVFLAEQDQFYFEQYGIMDTLKKKFYGAPIERGKLIYEEHEGIHIAVHIRRGDVIKDSTDSNIRMRWLDVDYYRKVLEQLFEHLRGRAVHIYVFSQGTEKEFASYLSFENVHYCLDMGAQDTFWHLTQADILVISKSSFSYKPALLSDGIIIAPRKFWHGYPESNRWIIVDEEEPKINKML